MLEATGLLKKYGDLTVVNDVSLHVQPGEIVSIIGPSGAGKSTLLHLLGVLDRPDKGQVRVDGTDVFALSAQKQAQFRNKHLGFVFQFHHLLPEFSAVENVAMPLWIGGEGRREGLKRAEAALETVGLATRVAHKPTEMSGGEQQRVAIARALVGKPSIIMLDEPTGNLDSNNADAVHRLFLSLRAETGQTFVMITHNEELARMTNRTLLMRDGRIVEEVVN